MQLYHFCGKQFVKKSFEGRINQGDVPKADKNRVGVCHYAAMADGRTGCGQAKLGYEI